MFTPADHTFAICAYKTSPYLKNCIESLLEQTEQASILLATSTPNDHIASLADRYEIPLVVRDGTPGIGVDWNFALASTDKPLVTIAHQDDWYHPDYLSEMLDKINLASDPLLYFTNYAELRDDSFVEDNRLLSVKRRMLKQLEDPAKWSNCKVRCRALSLGSPICCPSVTLVKAKTDPDIFLSELQSNLDWEAWANLAEQPGDFVYNPRILMAHRIHEESETTRLIENNGRAQEDLAMFKRFWPAPIARAINLLYAQGIKSNSRQ